MTISRTKFVLMTKSRPTEFLTSSGETTGNFEKALWLERSEVEAEMAKLDCPGEFETAPVVISLEV